MAPRREILDSEDDGSDFGDDAELAGVEAHHETEVPRHEPETVDASHNASTGSTDPSFFQRIYDEQQAAWDVHETVPDTLPARVSDSTYTEISSAPPPGQKPRAADFSSLTPITDPAPASRKSKRTREVRQAEVIDLTDITTPSKQAASGASDVWDVPSSARSQRATRTYGKRQRAEQQLSLQQDATSEMLPTQDPYDFPDSTPRTRKRTKRDTPSSFAQHAQDSSPVMLVPTEETTSSGRRATRSRGKNSASLGDSSMVDTSAALYITQSTLTASQKQEYQMVSLSSEAGLEVPETSLPMPLFGGGGEVYKSSGVTTIAYPTPSRIGSSRRMAGGVEGLEGDGLDGASPGLDIDHILQQSSPDVLNDMSTTKAPKAKRTRIKIVSSVGLVSSEMDPPPSTRRTRKRKIVQEDEDTWELDPLDGGQGNDYPLQPDAHEKGEAKDAAAPATQPDPDMNDQLFAPPELEPTNIELTESPAAAPPAPTQKKKPGRKKKGSKPKQPTPPVETDPDPEPAAEPAEVAEPPATRKRGRPRKSEPTKPAPAEPQVEADISNNPPSPQPLSEVPGNSQSHSVADTNSNGGGDSKGDGLSSPAVVTEPAIKKGMEKEKVTQNQKDQKVQYRVGLSKRSRIAPLLKFVKKPT
jgi:hypothetical protein